MYPRLFSVLICSEGDKTMSLQEFLLLFLRQARGLLGTEVTASSSPVPKDTPELNQPHLFLFSLSLAQQQESSEPPHLPPLSLGIRGGGREEEMQRRVSDPFYPMGREMKPPVVAKGWFFPPIYIIAF